ncbi:MAG TPA: hypothetical protein VNW06_11690 [Cytophagaceae bacterium]|nr:hypothetical protein [Cytophagaceae bacterium]
MINNRIKVFFMFFFCILLWTGIEAQDRQSASIGDVSFKVSTIDSLKLDFSFKIGSNISTVKTIEVSCSEEGNSGDYLKESLWMSCSADVCQILGSGYDREVKGGVINLTTSRSGKALQKDIYVVIVLKDLSGSVITNYEGKVYLEKIK